MALSKEERKRAIQAAQNNNGELESSDYSVNDKDDLRMKSLVQLAMRTKEGVRGATEYVKQYLLNNRSIYSIRGNRVEMWIYQDGIYVPYGQTYIKEFCSEIFTQAYTDSLAREVIDKIYAQTQIDQKDFFGKEEKYKICCNNGVVNLNNGELEEFTHEEFHFSKIPVLYDPSAEPTKISLFLSEVLRNPDTDIQVFKELLGWLLVKDYKPEKAVMFMGSGRNGKGKTIDILRAFIGEDNYSSVPLVELDPRNNQYAASSLMNKLANFGGDVSEGMLKDTSVIRSLTGRDSIEAQRKHIDSVKFVNYAKLVFAANKPPAVKEDNDGWWNRWVWLDFPYFFAPKKVYESRKHEKYVKLRDPDIVNKILDEEELSGMLNWALEGLKDLSVNGNFSDSNTANDIRNRWIYESNSFEAFCMDNLEEKMNSLIDKSELRRAYGYYCRDLRKENLNDDVIKRVLEKRFGSSTKRVTRSDGERVYCWTNVAFNVEREDHPDRPKISYSTLGLESDESDFYRVKQFIRVHENKSVGGLVDQEFIISSLKEINVEDVINLLLDQGEIIQPKPGRYKLL